MSWKHDTFSLIIVSDFRVTKLRSVWLKIWKIIYSLISLLKSLRFLFLNQFLQKMTPFKLQTFFATIGVKRSILIFIRANKVLKKLSAFGSRQKFGIWLLQSYEVLLTYYSGLYCMCMYLSSKLFNRGLKMKWCIIL